MSAEHAVDWIFLRGLARESAHWDDFPERFAQAIPRARIHLLDLPGNGRHWRLTSPTSIPETLAFVRDEALKIKSVRRPFYLFTVSLGSMLALEWARQYGAELRGMVLINTSLRGFNPLYRRLSWRCWPLLTRILACRNPVARERLILRLTAWEQTATPELIAARAQTAWRHPVKAANVLRQLLAAARHRPLVERPAVPLLLLNSLGDRMVDPACSDVIARRWQAPLATHPKAGHDLPLDAPDWVIAEVQAWLGNLD